MTVRVVDGVGGIAPGDWKRLRVGAGPVGVSWTLVLEVLFYLTLPALALLIARSPVRLAVIACWSLFGAFAIYLLVPAADVRLTTSVFPARYVASLTRYRVAKLSAPFTMMS